jgi:hypothetical protein
MSWSWQLARRETKTRVDAGALVAAEEEPVFTTEDLTAQVLLGDVVVQGQAPVLEESAERDALVAGIAEGPGDRRLVEDCAGLLLAPGKEGLGERPGLLAADLLALFASRPGAAAPLGEPKGSADTAATNILRRPRGPRDPSADFGGSSVTASWVASASRVDCSSPCARVGCVCSSPSTQALAASSARPPGTRTSTTTSVSRRCLVATPKESECEIDMADEIVLEPPSCTAPA